MILISHRGNVSGINTDLENSPEYIDLALARYNVEVDLWSIDGGLFLGHDFPSYRIEENYLDERKNRLWVHCKSVDCFLEYHKRYHCFFHDKEDIVVTSNMYVITHVNYGIKEGCVAMMPEVHGYSIEQLSRCSGICSDVIEEYRYL